MPASPRSPSEYCPRPLTFEQCPGPSPIVAGQLRGWHDQDVSRLVLRPGLPLPTLATRLAPRGRPGLLPPGHRRHTRPRADLRPLRARASRPAALPPPDDGRTAAVLL